MIRRLAVVLAGVAAIAAAAPAVAQAHPLGNFTVNRYSLVVVGKDSVKVTFVLDEAEYPHVPGARRPARPQRPPGRGPGRDVPTFAQQAAPDGERHRRPARARRRPRHRHAQGGTGRPALPAHDRPVQRSHLRRRAVHGDTRSRHPPSGRPSSSCRTGSGCGCCGRPASPSNGSKNCRHRRGRRTPWPFVDAGVGPPLAVGVRLGGPQAHGLISRTPAARSTLGNR